MIKQACTYMYTIEEKKETCLDGFVCTEQQNKLKTLLFQNKSIFKAYIHSNVKFMHTNVLQHNKCLNN